MIFLFSENIGFSGEVQHFSLVLLIQSFSTIHVLKSSCIYLRIFTLLYKQWSFQKISDFLGCFLTNYTKHFHIKPAYELTNIPYVDRFQNNLYSQVTGKLRSSTKYVRVLCFWKLSNNLCYGFVMLKQCTWCEQCQL